MTLRDFQERLLASGLMTKGEIEQSRRSLQDALGPEFDQASAVEWGKHLVQAGQATLFQVSALTSGRPSRLVYGNYILIDKVASGGMGDVYKGVDRRSGDIAVVKVLPAAAAVDPELSRRFQREIELLSAVEHPNIVRAFDAGEANGSPFLAMEFVDGSDFGRIVRHRGPMAPEDAVECIRQAAVGLAYAHERGVIHRDVKPTNLMLDAEGVVKILDLGLARIVQSEDGLTSTGSVLGSIDYMAPEQGNDSKLADHRADIYALGCTLYFLMTGRLVFDGKNISQKLLAHAESTPPSLRETCPTAPEKLEQLYLKTLAKDPASRPKKMSDVIAALTKIQRSLPTPDLSRYERSNPAPRDNSNVAFGSTLPGATARPRKTETAAPKILPLAPRRNILTTIAAVPAEAAWRGWLGGAAICVTTVLLAFLLLSGE